MNLSAWLAYLETLHPSEIELGLDRISQVAENLAIDFSRQTVVTVGGTNGKGSTCCFLESLLKSHGKRVGVYRSPHLVKYNERISIDGVPVSDADLCRAFSKIEAARAGISLSYFEFGTLAAFLIFADSQPDYLLLEVGLGGRLDAVNIIDTDLAIITNIALDHTEWLGDNREKIGFEKAGIMRSNKPVIFGESDIPASVVLCAESIGARLYQAGTDFSYQQDERCWSWQGEDIHGRSYRLDMHPAQQSLLNFFPSNAALAVQAFLLLDVEKSAHTMEAALNRASISGRFQLLQRKTPIVLDVAHNPHAMAKLAANIKHFYPDKNVHVLIAMLATKDYQNSLNCLLPVARSWYLASLQNSRGTPAKILYNELRNSGQEQVRLFDSVREAFQATEQSLDENDLLLVTGSFYTVAAVLELI